MALQARASSTLNADPKPVFSAKLHKRSESLFQKIPPQKEEPKLLAPPVLHFTQLSIGGWQIISLITRGEGGELSHLKFFKIVKSPDITL
jgi:hypothetical protein